MTEKEWLQIVVVPLITALLAAGVQIFIANKKAHPPRKKPPQPKQVFPWKRIWSISLLTAGCTLIILLLLASTSLHPQSSYPLITLRSDLSTPVPITQLTKPIPSPTTFLSTSTSITQLTKPTPLPTTFTALPTPVPKGSLLASYNFDKPSDGFCDDYDSSRVGYVDSKYYVSPPANGWIAVCAQIARWQPKGSLEVTVTSNDPEPRIYGFGLMWGWEGTFGNTQYACTFSVRKTRFSVLQDGLLIQSDPTYDYEFIQIKEGIYTRQSDTLRIKNLDTSKHTIRFSLDADGIGIGYLDENFVAAY